MDDDHIAQQLEEVFGKQNLYEILCVTKDATTEEIKKSYKKLALKYHPDKGGNSEQFQCLSIAYTILSDDDKRKLYNDTGTINGEDDTVMNRDYDSWYQYYRELFPTVTITDIEKYQQNYINSIEEHNDVVTEYQNHNGNLSKMMNYILFAEQGDELRICSIIDKAIDDQELELLPIYKKQREKLFKSTTSSNKKVTNKRKKDNTEDMSALINSIQSRKSATQSQFASIFSKYGDVNEEDDIDDEEFQKIQQKMSKKSKK